MSEVDYQTELRGRERLVTELREACSMAGATVTDIKSIPERQGFEVELSISHCERTLFVRWVTLIDQNHQSIIRDIRDAFPSYLF